MALVPAMVAKNSEIKEKMPVVTSNNIESTVWESLFYFTRTTVDCKYFPQEE